MNVPVLFLVFNRPMVTQLVFNEIKRAKPKELYIAIDGARNNNLNDIVNVKEVMEIVKDVNWDCEVSMLKRDKNLGCGLAISSAIDWFFSNVDEGIILEDDCVPSQDFFLFSEEMLIKYRDNDQVMAINGSNPFSNKDLKNSYAFTSYNLIWGWATWKKAWECYQYDLSKTSDISRIMTLLKKFKFDFVSVRSWHKHINLAIENSIINTWDYQWIFACFKNNGKIIIPKVNLIENIGNFEDPTHGVVDMFYYSINTEKLEFPLIHPKSININKSLEFKIKKERFGNTFLQFFIQKLRKIKNSF